MWLQNKNWLLFVVFLLANFYLNIEMPCGSWIWFCYCFSIVFSLNKCCVLVLSFLEKSKKKIWKTRTIKIIITIKNVFLIFSHFFSFLKEILWKNNQSGIWFYLGHLSAVHLSKLLTCWNWKSELKLQLHISFRFKKF